MVIAFIIVVVFLVIPSVISLVNWLFGDLFELIGALFRGIFGLFKPKRKVRQITKQQINLSQIDYMDGHSFEYWCANLLRRIGYKDVYVTQGSGDQGVDIVAVKDGVRHAFQCKRYSSKVGNTPVQEVYAGMKMYNCSVGTVITNQTFTDGAFELAERVVVNLWDRHTLETLVSRIDIPTRPFTDDKIAYYKNLPGVDKLDDMEDYEYLWFANADVLNIDILGWDELLYLASRVFEKKEHAEHLAKAVEKHFCAKTEVRQCENGYYIYVEVRVRSIRSNFEDDRFVVATWA